MSVAIVGGGFSGAAVAFHLARAGIDSTVFEPRASLGAGLAYDDPDPAHRVNVPAAFMSMRPEDEGDFSRWLEASGRLRPGDRVGEHVYPARALFGAYVAETLAPFVEAGRVRPIREPVVALRQGWELETASGARHLAKIVVIATTHPPPAVPRELAGLIADALAPQAFAGVGASERVLIVGAGLTAADIVATLDAQGHRGQIVMISRHGLRSRGHPPAPCPPEGDYVSAPERQASALLARLRRDIAARGWRPVLEAARVQGQHIWAALTPAARRRLARHVRPYWDVHRFRLAPQVEALMEAKLADGSLAHRKARIRAVRASEVDLGQGFEPFDRVALATGPAHGDILRAQPWLAGHVALCETGLGLKTSREGRAIGPQGEAETLFVAGPLARGTFGELMGLPAVSLYARFVAEQIARCGSS